MTEPEVVKGPNESPSAAPVPKVWAAGMGGAITVIVVAALDLMGYEASPALAAAITTVAAFGAGYMTPPRGW